MTNLILILGDQLNNKISSLRYCNKKEDMIFMCEVIEEATYVKHHKKKLALIFSAMRHFAQELQDKNYNLIYTKLDDKNNTGSFTKEIARMLKNHPIDKIIVTFPGEYRVLEMIESWEKEFKIPVDIIEDDRFFATPEEFQDWAKDKKQLRMEFFYRLMRIKHNILMKDHNPIGGKWNYDSENRKPPKEGLNIPKRFTSTNDKITEDVIKMVKQKFNDHFGDIDNFNYAVTRSYAKQALKLFIAQRLKSFGDYQDAMIEGEPWMFHSHISFYLNCGLLLPQECVEAALQAYQNKQAPLNAVEGFIRQILGWREYIRGIYWHYMPKYYNRNFLNAKRKLPNFFWDGKTDMNCLKQSITETKENAYAHHIQRLMVIGNFALIAGLSPKEVNEWYMIVYADAYQWVELPNVTGMILFADGGVVASKPYAAGGSYINKMSNYCKNCKYKVTEKTGDNACPFNYLYWNFLVENRKKFEKNNRIAMMYKTFDRMDDNKKRAIQKSSKKFLEQL